MRDLATESAAAYPYCIIFILLIQFVFMNLFVATVLANFNAVLTKSKKEVISARSLRDFVHAWQVEVDMHERFLSRLLKTTGTDSPSERLAHTRQVTNNPEIESAIDERCDRLALHLMDSTYLPTTRFSDFFVKLRPPLGLTLAKSMSPSEMIRFIRLANIPVTKTGMLNARATLSALIDQALGAEVSDESYQTMKSALTIRMVSDSKSTAAHQRSEAERAQTHSVAEELATRRLQITARYVLGRRKIEKLIVDGDYTREDGTDLLKQLSLQYNRQVLASNLRLKSA